MRVKVSFYSDIEQTIDMNYNHYLSSLVYRFLESSDREFSARLHREGYMIDNKHYKLFCFSRLFPSRAKPVGGFLKVKGMVNWYVTSPDIDFLCHFSKGLLSSETIRIGDARFQVSLAEIMKQPKFSRRMVFNSISPITTHTVIDCEDRRKTVSCAPYEEKFVENLKNNLLKKATLLYGDEISGEVINININDKFKNDRGKLIKFKDTRVKGYMIPFTMECDERLMEVAYDCGVGEKNSGGFGCIEVMKGGEGKDERGL